MSLYLQIGLNFGGYKGTEDIRIVIKIPYPNFGTIPISIEEPLLELAKLDIKLLLYPELKMYDKLDTADGSIDLKLDGWDNAEPERRDLINDWRNKAFPNSTKKRYIYE